MSYLVHIRSRAPRHCTIVLSIALLVGFAIGQPSVARASESSRDAPVIVLLGFKHHNLNPATAKAFMDSMRSTLASSEKIRLATFDSLSQSSLGSSSTLVSFYSSSVDCARRAGRDAGADVTVFGSIILFGNLLTTRATVVDFWRSSVIHRMELDSSHGVAAISTLAHRLSREILEIAVNLPTSRSHDALRVCRREQVNTAYLTSRLLFSYGI